MENMIKTVTPVILYDSGLGVYEIRPGLFQAGQPETIDDWDKLWRLSHVVVSLDGSIPPAVPTNRLHIAWYIEDGPLPSEIILESLVDFLCSLLLHHSVVVHCSAGINRSGLINALIARQQLTLPGRLAAALVRAHRPGALINGEFNRYLNSLYAV